MRGRDHQPTLDPVLLKEAVAGVREATDLVVQLSTGGAITDPLEQRLTVLDADPDSCSLTCGTTNFGDGVFLNPWGFMVELYRLAQEREVVPEFELFELGHVHALRRLIDECGLPHGGTGPRRLRHRRARLHARHRRRPCSPGSPCCRPR